MRRKTYVELKAAARNEAMAWLLNFPNNTYSWEDIVYYTYYFYRKGRRYGLIREFRENGIIYDFPFPCGIYTAIDSKYIK